jgi:hypothetical protein
MGWRGLGVVVLCAVLGVVAGVTIARATPEEPALGGTATPLPASSPSYPVDPPVRIKPDPDDPPLERDLPTHRVEIGQSPFGLSLPVPDGWQQTNSEAGEWKWTPPPGPDGDNDFTYFLRVTLVGNQHVTIPGALQARIQEVDLAEGTDEFDLESQTPDTFTVTYVLDHHRRLAIERFISTDGTDDAFANIAVVGRLSDREGLDDLMETVTDGAS